MTAIAEQTTGEFVLLDRSGHKTSKDDARFAWNKDNPQQVAAARAVFNEFVGERKHLAFVAEGKSGDKRGEQIKEFDPTAERIIFAPQNQGG